MAQSQSTSPWVWASLLLLLGLFVAFILFLDQKVVRSGGEAAVSAPAGGQENKPTIDFYEVLPKRIIEIPISDQERDAIENPTINKQAEQKTVLQVGSFQQLGEADSMKARLAFLGLEASIQSAQVNQDTWHRVQLGPFTSNSQLSRAQNLLIENEIKYIRRTLKE